VLLLGVFWATGYIINNAHKVKLAKTTDANSIEVLEGLREGERARAREREREQERERERERERRVLDKNQQSIYFFD